MRADHFQVHELIASNNTTIFLNYLDNDLMSGNSEITFDRLMRVAFVEWCVCVCMFVCV